MLPGTSIAMSVGSIQVGIMERIDRTDPGRKLRFEKRRNGRRIKTRRWFDKTGASEIPQKTREKGNTDLRWWITPGRFGGTLVRLYRKKD